MEVWFPVLFHGNSGREKLLLRCSFPHSPLKGWENYRSPNLVSSASWETNENQYAVSKTFPNLQLLGCKPSLPQMLGVWSVLTENPSICLQHFMLDSQRTYPNLFVFCIFSRFFFFMQQVHFPLQGIWQMGDKDFSSSPSSQVENEPQHSWHSRSRLISNSTVFSLILVIHRQLRGK